MKGCNSSKGRERERKRTFGYADMIARPARPADKEREKKTHTDL